MNSTYHKSIDHDVNNNEPRKIILLAIIIGLNVKFFSGRKSELRFFSIYTMHLFYLFELGISTRVKKTEVKQNYFTF